MSEAIRKYLSANNMTQRDMARELKISVPTMSKIARGERMPRIDLVERLEILTSGYVGPRSFYKNPDIWEKSAELEDASFEEDLNNDLSPFQELSSWGKLKRLFGG
mgnify:CR=1 FL=1|tara:strand:- start:273 stop:590 length:318 start_codon:yes stop_codon:yes gene_type:complete